MKKARPELSDFYDIYSPMVFGIALQISPNQQKAEVLLQKAFELIHEKDLAKLCPSTISIELIKLIFKAAEELHFIGPQTKHTAPLISQIIAKETTVRETCLQNNRSVIQLGKEIRAELNSLRLQAIDIYTNPPENQLKEEINE